MSNCVPIIFKSSADNLLLVRCKQCKKQYLPLNYKQCYCKDFECKRIRRETQQRAYRRKKAGKL